MAYLPAIVAVSYYFEKRRSLATGVAACGSGVGTFVFAPLTNSLLARYSWKGTLLIDAAILLNCVLCGSVFRPLNLPKKKKNPDPPEFELVVEEKPRDEIRAVQRNAEVKSASNLQLSKILAVERRRQVSESAAAMSRASSTHPAGPLARKDVFYTRSLGHIPQYRADRDEYIRSMTSLSGQPQPLPDNSWLTRISITPELRHTISEMMDFRLLVDAVFVLFAVANLLTCVGYIVPYVFLPNRGLRLRFTGSQASWLISVVGVSDTVGRVVFGFVADVKCVNRLMLYNTVLVICGVCSVISVFMYTFALQLCYSFSFGFFIGTSIFQQAGYFLYRHIDARQSVFNVFIVRVVHNGGGGATFRPRCMVKVMIVMLPPLG